MPRLSFVHVALAAVPLFALFAAGCGSTPAASGPVGGPVPDASDQHCIADGGLAPTKVGLCLTGADDAGADDGGSATIDYGPTLYNSSGYDDDCKYQVSFTSGPIRKNANVTFTVTITGLDPAGPVVGGSLYAEVYLSDIHPAPNSGVKTVEKGAGVYDIGPIVFDASGLWTVRFHVDEMCSDAPEDSPHGHAAFYIEVP